MKINKNITIGEVLNITENGQQVLGGFGLHCFGCPMSKMETIEQAAVAHRIPLDFMLNKLNEDLIFKNTKKEVSNMGCGCKCAAKTTEKPAAKKTAPAKKK